MRIRGLAAVLVLCTLMLFPALAVQAQDDPPAAQQPPAAAPAKPARKPAPPAKTPKPGEPIALEQQPGQVPAAPMPGAPEAPAKGKPAAPAKPVKGATPAASKVPSVRLTVGALLPLSGAQAAQGAASRAAIELAVADVNDYLAGNGSADRINVLIEDTESTPAKALERLKFLATSGARAVIGPYTDNEVDQALPFADKNGLLLLSQGSAGPYLAKPDDALLRFSPSDAFQAEALAVLASQEGATHIIPIWEGDMYGDELVTHIKGQFANQGGQVVPGVRFRPEVSQFASYVADLKAQIDKNVKDKKKLAVVVAARGAQTAGILREAAKLAGLDEPRWYGCDDSALRGGIVQDQNVARFAAKVRMAFARLGETGTALYSEVEKRIEDRIQAFVDTQAVVAYDIVWLLAFTGLASGDDASTLRKAVTATAQRFYGASGWMALNEYGDRAEDYDFDFWTIREMEGKFFWVKTARYQFDPGSVKQLVINAPEKE
ncbi:hypothetical protein NNJEOMEG_03263 [Fundidesulfovibrio magnetotacticus]|uniref:Receptor ligand binding region domain-containing protein n=1 Tax=Fundidesulfovibrio magnetotacticus TaxID=2730080 RepID=A0A6V8LWX9_9BACT|nr:ABC transporter substrate-binding protein [Fundidesulfovibrio magnetotacticus]GFK95400.1 hypothetical protein NNJEOMEG_03263 [Fundidesulfovibrio magnetotacticus]